MSSENTDIQISVIIPTYNNGAIIDVVLESLAKQEQVEEIAYEIIVVDNNSRDNTKQVVESFVPKFNNRLRYVFEGNQGVTYARNRGVDEAKGKILAFTDDDCCVDKNWLYSILSTFDQYAPDALQGKVVLATEVPGDLLYPEWFIQQRMAHVNYGEETREIKDKDLVTANMSIRAEIFEKYGKFNADPVYRNCEDTEFSVRISRAGIKKFYNPGVKVEHHFSLKRLNDKEFFRQSFDWGRAVVLFEPTQLTPLKHFLYCFKQLIIHVFILGADYIKHDRQQVFLAKNKVYGLWGRCVQIFKNKRKG